ncbi:Uncharacterised protein [Sphingobacterium thalpophilum]|uniref:Uncharacterized protein n=2 Tax=Sphingobacterium thalpophilum TaxID=259 RepID=A0A4U9VGP3_9SPHI|nr:Uncharacterised protein [Sphingobacterium thalpophilum]
MTKLSTRSASKNYECLFYGGRFERPQESYTMLKNLFLVFVTVSVGSLLFSCRKGELVQESEELARVLFKSYGSVSPDIKRITVDGKAANDDNSTFVFVRSKDTDSSLVLGYNSKDEHVLAQRLPIRAGLNTFGVHEKSPIDPTLVVAENPLGADLPVIPDTIQVKILNYNKTISPEGLPIRLAIYKGKLVFDDAWGMDLVSYDQTPLLTTGVIGESIPKEFIKLPKKPFSHAFFKAEVLDEALKPVLVNGQKVFLFFYFTVDIGIVYLPQKEPDVYFDFDGMTAVDGLGYSLDNVWLKK